jgi:hypothetical protein
MPCLDFASSPVDDAEGDSDGGATPVMLSMPTATGAPVALNMCVAYMHASSADALACMPCELHLYPVHESCLFGFCGPFRLICAKVAGQDLVWDDSPAFGQPVASNFERPTEDAKCIMCEPNGFSIDDEMMHFFS